MLEYQQRVTTVTLTRDGDTSLFVVRLTPKIHEDIVGRLSGWDCPESRARKGVVNAYEIARARDALAVTREFLASPGALWCRREDERDSFGRELVTLWHTLPEGIETDLGEILAGLELATRWPTRWRDVYGRPS